MYWLYLLSIGLLVFSGLYRILLVNGRLLYFLWIIVRVLIGLNLQWNKLIKIGLLVLVLMLFRNSQCFGGCWVNIVSVIVFLDLQVVFIVDVWVVRNLIRLVVVDLILQLVFVMSGVFDWVSIRLLMKGFVRWNILLIVIGVGSVLLVIVMLGMVICCVYSFRIRLGSSYLLSVRLIVVVFLWLSWLYCR